jgi:hypothetical protein
MMSFNAVIKRNNSALFTDERTMMIRGRSGKNIQRKKDYKYQKQTICLSSESMNGMNE